MFKKAENNTTLVTYNLPISKKEMVKDFMRRFPPTRKTAVLPRGPVKSVNHPDMAKSVWLAVQLHFHFVNTA